MLDGLPEHLRERTLVWPGGAPQIGGDRAFVLCWLHHAVRDDENPALDVALQLGGAIGLPVLVYMGFGGAHPFNSDRHHVFMLEGARDLAHALAARGFNFLCHLPLAPRKRGPLPALASRAAVVVTEDFPVPPMQRWTDALAQQIDVPLLAVDCACVHPMRLVQRRFDRAFAFRSALESSWQERIARPWPHSGEFTESRQIDLHALLAEISELHPVDPRTMDIDAAVAACAVDHSVPPVRDTTGGMRAAADRWALFRDGPLRRYHLDRNDPLRAGASRLSAYLHHGHLSPFRVAREAAAIGGDGAEKFLDELLVWRELSLHFCLHSGSSVESLAALPSWARQTLAAHERDLRSFEPTDEALERGRTGDILWDAAQRSLMLRGELHNNVRMTWGKALVAWSPNAEVALRRLIDLNHRFALDGSDANSYGGLLWCLGLFDRPFEPDQPVIGRIRPRPTDVHARRLDVARWRAMIEAPIPSERVAVIGGGIAGLACAQVLSDQGVIVTVFDKGRGPGGRCSTRRIDLPSGAQAIFDHGTPLFRARDERFLRMLRQWELMGVVARWRPTRQLVRRGSSSLPTAEGWVGTPGMNAVLRHLSSDLDVRFATRIERIERSAQKYRLRDDAGVGYEHFDAIVLALPAPQAASLLKGVHDALSDDCRVIEMTPRIVAMVTASEDSLIGDIDFLEQPDDSMLAMAVAEHRKPGGCTRTPARWTLHASDAWSRAHLETRPERSAAELAARFTEWTGQRVQLLAGHRWRYARSCAPSALPCLFEAEQGIGVCGEGFGGSGVESAWLSGRALAGRLLAHRSWREVSEPGLFG